MHKHQVYQVTMINLLLEPFLIGFITLARIDLSITTLACKYFIIITLVGKDLSIKTVAAKGLGIITLTSKDLGMITHRMSHHNVHNQWIQAMSYHMEEITNHTIKSII